MKKILVLSIFIVFASRCLSQEERSFRHFSSDERAFAELDTFLLKNFFFPTFLNLDCNYNYLAMIIRFNSKGEVTSVEFLNEAHRDFKKGFNCLKKFKFRAPEKFSQHPLLLFATIDQRNKDACPVLYPKDMSPSKVTHIILEIVRKQLKKEPNTILYGTFEVVSTESGIKCYNLRGE